MSRLFTILTLLEEIQKPIALFKILLSYILNFLRELLKTRNIVPKTSLLLSPQGERAKGVEFMEVPSKHLKILFSKNEKTEIPNGLRMQAFAGSSFDDALYTNVQNSKMGKSKYSTQFANIKNIMIFAWMLSAFSSSGHSINNNITVDSDMNNKMAFIAKESLLVSKTKIQLDTFGFMNDHGEG